MRERVSERVSERVKQSERVKRNETHAHERETGREAQRETSQRDTPSTSGTPFLPYAQSDSMATVACGSASKRRKARGEKREGKREGSEKPACNRVLVIARNSSPCNRLCDIGFRVVGWFWRSRVTHHD